MKTLRTLMASFMLAVAGVVVAVDPPGTNLIWLPLGSYSNGVPFYLPSGTNTATWTNNPYGWEQFHAINNDFLWVSNRISGLQTAGVLTNGGVVWCTSTNISAPDGSLCTLTNGQVFVRSNGVWVIK